MATVLKYVQKASEHNKIILNKLMSKNNSKHSNNIEKQGEEIIFH